MGFALGGGVPMTFDLRDELLDMLREMMNVLPRVTTDTDPSLLNEMYRLRLDTGGAGAANGRPDVERIAYDDRILLVIDGIPETAEPTVAVRRGRLEVASRGEILMTMDLPFSVDAETSSASLKNGILEIELRRADGNDKNTGDKDIVLM